MLLRARDRPPSLASMPCLPGPAAAPGIAALNADERRSPGGGRRRQERADSARAVADVDYRHDLAAGAGDRALAGRAGLVVHPTVSSIATVTVVVSVRGQVPLLRGDDACAAMSRPTAAMRRWRSPDDLPRDAERRDFTINALSLRRRRHRPRSARRLCDLLARQVRFIGDAQERIARIICESCASSASTRNMAGAVSTGGPCRRHRAQGRPRGLSGKRICRRAQEAAAGRRGHRRRQCHGAAVHSGGGAARPVRHQGVRGDGGDRCGGRRDARRHAAARRPDAGQPRQAQGRAQARQCRLEACSPSMRRPTSRRRCPSPSARWRSTGYTAPVSAMPCGSAGRAPARRPTAPNGAPF